MWNKALVRANVKKTLDVEYRYSIFHTKHEILCIITWLEKYEEKGGIACFTKCSYSCIVFRTFRGLMIVTVTGFIPLSPLSVVSTMDMWESSQWLGKNIVQSTG